MKNSDSGQNKIRRKLIIHKFNPKTMEIESTETTSTKPMSETEFAKLIQQKTKESKGICFEVRRVNN